MPAVSVITPAYNVDAYLEATAQSVLGQTYRDLELIIADDGSTDGSLDIARRVQASDPSRVQLLSRPNGGPSAARNAALGLARGEYLALLDGDDIWQPDFLARQMAVFAADPDIDLVTANGWNLGGRRHGQLVRPHPDTRPPLTLATIISDEQAVFVMTVFRRRVFERIGGFDEALRGNEDFDYWMRAALAGFRFHRNSEPLAWYRRRDDSLSANAVRMLTGAILVCQKLRPLMIDRPERELLDRQIAYYETELAAARVRAALAQRNVAEAAEALQALHARRPTVRTALAGLLARHAAPVLDALYQIKQACGT
jgi:glycosyltransferase involved in cell wall biosynthesis